MGARRWRMMVDRGMAGLHPSPAWRISTCCCPDDAPDREQVREKGTRTPAVGTSTLMKYEAGKVEEEKEAASDDC